MDSKETVILIHALAANKLFMYPLATYLKKQGFTVYNWDYQSRKFTIEEIANQLNDYIKQLNLDNSKIHFVTHSMGGIIIRYYLKYFNLANLGKIVMLAPPNNGSEIVETFKNQFWFYKYFGPASITLGVDDKSIPKNLGPVNFTLGVITGNVAYPFSNYFLPKGNDGVVSIESSKVEGMKEHLILNTSHVSIVFCKKAIQYTANFLKYGSFKK